jgi:hypothetical protein
MYVCMYVCMCVYIYIYVYIYMYTIRRELFLYGTEAKDIYISDSEVFTLWLKS